MKTTGLGLICLVVVMICAQWSAGGVGMVSSAAVDAGSRFNDQKEQEVLEISRSAMENHGNCFLLNSCKAACSRAVCHPQREDLEASVCTNVESNEFCPLSTAVNNKCKKMRLNYNNSFITLPPGANFENLQTELTRDICLQRELDPTFKTLSFPDYYSYAFYGSTSGAWRSFPGRDNSDEGCSNYDPRKRPWYLDGTSVVKQVKILIDTSNPMGSGVNGEFQRPPGTTYLDVAKDLVLAAIRTLSPGDFVEVVAFNSSGAFSLGLPVNVGNYDLSSLSSVVHHPELDPLEKSVKALARSADPRPSNLTAAIVTAASNFQATATKSLKVVVVISDGQFLPVNSSSFPTALIAQEKAKVLVFKLPLNSDSDPASDPFLLKTSLPTVLCGVQGSFELLEAPATANPLYAIRSYFSFLANVHAIAVANTPSFSNVYRSSSQELNAVTVTSPAFDKEERLIGVAGIDVFLDQLESQVRALVVADLTNRRRGTIPAPENITLTCSYQNQTAATAVCASSALPTDGVICKKTDTKSLAERVCCGTCEILPPPPPFAWWKILLITFGSLVGVIILGCGYKRFCIRRSKY